MAVIAAGVFLAGYAFADSGLAPVTVLERGSDVNGVSEPDQDFGTPPALFITETGASSCTNIANPINYDPPGPVPYTQSVYISVLGIGCEGSQLSQGFTFETPTSDVAESPTFFFSLTYTNSSVTTTASWTVGLNVPAATFGGYNSDLDVYLEVGDTMFSGGISGISVIVT
jgi:hypothetical protein